MGRDLSTAALPISSRFQRSDVEPSTFQRVRTYSLCFHTLAHSFAFIKNSTHLFSSSSALFAQKHPGWGYPRNLRQASGRSGAVGLPRERWGASPFLFRLKTIPGAL